MGGNTAEVLGKELRSLRRGAEMMNTSRA